MEILHNGKLLLADLFIDKLLRDEVAKQEFRRASTVDRNLTLCAHCENPIFFVDATAIDGDTIRAAHFKHFGARGDSTLQAELDLCPYYQGSQLNQLFSQFYKGEGEWHYRTKHWLKGILESDPFVRPGSVQVEKHIFGASDNQLSRRRRPDLSFADKDGKAWAIELTSNWMNPEVIAARQLFFLDEGINLIWLFAPQAVDSEVAIGTERSTFKYVLFGMSEREEGGQFNAFVLNDANIQNSTIARQLEVTCVFPHFEYISNTRSIEYHLRMQLTTLSELKTSANSHLPYLVDTMGSRLEAERALQKHETLIESQVKQLDTLAITLCEAVEKLVLQTAVAQSEMNQLRDKIDKTIAQYLALSQPAGRVELVKLNEASNALAQHHTRLNEKQTEYRRHRYLAEQARHRELDAIRQSVYNQMRSLVNDMISEIEKHTPTLSIMSIPNFEDNLKLLFEELKSIERPDLQEDLMQCLRRYDDQYISEIKRELAPLTRPIDFSRKYRPIIDKAIGYRTATHYYDFPNTIAEKAKSYAEEVLNKFSSILYWQALETLGVLEVEFPCVDDVRQLVAMNRYLIEQNLHRAKQFDFSWKLDQLDNYVSTSW